MAKLPQHRSTHRGPRVFRGARLPLYVAEALDNAAADEGLSINDALVNALCKAYGLPLDVPPRSTREEQQELHLREVS